jgi:hypothetical protein
VLGLVLDTIFSLTRVMLIPLRPSLSCKDLMKEVMAIWSWRREGEFISCKNTSPDRSLYCCHLLSLTLGSVTPGRCCWP